MGQERDDKQVERPVRSQDDCYYCGTAKTCERCTAKPSARAIAWRGPSAPKWTVPNTAGPGTGFAAITAETIEAAIRMSNEVPEGAPSESAPSPSSSPVPSPLPERAVGETWRVTGGYDKEQGGWPIDVVPERANPGVGGVEMAGCKHEQRAPHTCPFAEEINNDSRLCTCCAACESNCADDI